MSNPAMRTVRVTIFGIIALLAAWYSFSPNINRAKPETMQLATLLDQKTPIAPFELIDTQGMKFTEKSFRGHWTLMFFGYTTCPDVCPATLSLVRESWNQFDGKYPARFIFASINPQKDSVDKLRQFVKRFHPDFEGITGANQEVAKLSQQLNIVAQRDTSVTDVERIDHTAALMLIDPRGRLKAIFTPPLDSNAIVQDIYNITGSRQ